MHLRGLRFFLSPPRSDRSCVFYQRPDLEREVGCSHASQRPRTVPVGCCCALHGRQGRPLANHRKGWVRSSMGRWCCLCRAATAASASATTATACIDGVEWGKKKLQQRLRNLFVAGGREGGRTYHCLGRRKRQYFEPQSEAQLRLPVSSRLSSVCMCRSNTSSES